jgi:UDP-N-acetylmuramoyl-tripeptide--D-alanyl-D-alanine ligase
MFEYKVKEIIKATKGRLIKGNPEQILKGISTDTRKLNGEDIFVALKGENFDAHNFIDEKLTKQVKAIIVEKEIKVNADNVIKVTDTTKALQDMAKYHRANHKEVRVIGITGSSGKTSTKDILYNLLKTKYNVKKSEGNLNNHIGVPLTLFRLNGDEDFFIVEMGMSHQGEIKVLADIADPQIGLITNVGRAHIEFFDSVEGIAKTKGELIEALDSDDTAILNSDNKYTDILKSMADRGVKIKYFGFEKKADYRIAEYDYKKDGMNFKINSEDRDVKLKTNLIGEYNLYNIAAAVTAARLVNLEWSFIKKALKNITLTGLRSEIKEIDEITFINDCYNANPLSMKNAIKMLQYIEGGNKIAVLGDMLELGDIKKEAHREIGQYALEKNIDYLITTGPLGKYIAEGARESGMNINNIFYIEDKQKISDKLKAITKPQDIILIKGSRGMKMEVIYQDFSKDKG